MLGGSGNALLTKFGRPGQRLEAIFEITRRLEGDNFNAAFRLTFR
jgi:hypothetical protein